MKYRRTIGLSDIGQRTLTIELSIYRIEKKRPVAWDLNSDNISLKYNLFGPFPTVCTLHCLCATICAFWAFYSCVSCARLRQLSFCVGFCRKDVDLYC
jgi:hypothetical protein